MDYLFFDIECANCDGGNGKICSFGYVLADEKLNLIEKADIIINPRAPFRLKGWGNKRYIDLAYSEETFKKAPDFAFYYEKIAEMLTAGDRMIFGYAPENDAGFLRSEFERYRKKCVPFEFHDVQRMYKNSIGTENGLLCSLSAACEGLEIDTAFIEHKSCDDAYATMLVLKRVCEIKRGTPSELVKACAPCTGKLENGDVTADYFKPKPKLSPGEINMIKGVNRDNFRYLQRRLSGSSNKEQLSELSGKKVCLSWIYEFYHYRETVVILKAMYDLGIRYHHKIKDCEVFVKKPETQRGSCKRLNEILETREKRLPMILELSEFLALLGLTEETLAERAKNAEDIISDLKKGRA